MKKLNQYLFKKRSASYLRSTNRIRRFVNYETANTILLLFESDYIEKNRYIRKVIGQLVNDGKKVYAWGYINNKKATTAILPSFTAARAASGWTPMRMSTWPAASTPASISSCGGRRRSAGSTARPPTSWAARASALNALDCRTHNGRPWTADNLRKMLGRPD